MHNSLKIIKTLLYSINLVINLCKKIVYFSFYFNLKIVRFFCRTLYMRCVIKFKMIKYFHLPYIFMKSVRDTERNVTTFRKYVCFILDYLFTFAFS
jgi:hypothetical protein